MLFARAIQLSVAISMLREYQNSLRSNGGERKAEQIANRILVEIEGQSGVGVLTITGLRPQLLGEINRISEEINKLKTGYFNESIRASTLV